MKRIILILIIALVIAVPVNVFGTEKNNLDIIPYYESTKQVIIGFNIDENGSAKIIINVMPFSISRITNIKSDVSVINARSNNIVKTWTNASLEEIDSNDYLFYDNYKLITKGSYYVSYSIKLYSGKELKEIIRDKTEIKTYY